MCALFYKKNGSTGYSFAVKPANHHSSKNWQVYFGFTVEIMWPEIYDASLEFEPDTFAVESNQLGHSTLDSIQNNKLKQFLIFCNYGRIKLSY